MSSLSRRPYPPGDVALANRDMVAVPVLPGDLTPPYWGLRVPVCWCSSAGSSPGWGPVGLRLGVVPLPRSPRRASGHRRKVKKLESELAAAQAGHRQALTMDVLALNLPPQGAAAERARLFLLTCRERQTRVKHSCGLTREADVAAVAAAGAAYMVRTSFRGRRAASISHTARPPAAPKVGLVVDADDATLDAIVAAVPLSMLQLHGHERPRAPGAALKARYGLPVMKVIGVAEAVPGGDPRLFHRGRPDPARRQAAQGGAAAGGERRAVRLATGRRAPWLRPWMLAGG